LGGEATMVPPEVPVTTHTQKALSILFSLLFCVSYQYYRLNWNYAA